MNETEWLTCTNPAPMLAHLGNRASGRKLRLYACAWGYALWDRLPDERSRQAVNLAERFADGQATAEELRLAFIVAEQAWNEIPEVRGNRRVRGNKALLGTDTMRWAARLASRFASSEWDVHRAQFSGWVENSARKFLLANYLRDLFGNPFRPSTLDPGWLTWQGGVIRRLAETIYQDGAFHEMSVLGDALEEAGCQCPEILSHCRQGEGHIRGCWLLDMILNRE
jgi:hypothetical protein